jgi:hypothetical protein
MFSRNFVFVCSDWLKNILYEATRIPRYAVLQTASAVHRRASLDGIPRLFQMADEKDSVRTNTGSPGVICRMYTMLLRRLPSIHPSIIMTNIVTGLQSQEEEAPSRILEIRLSF